jgi:hypothetical protein
MNNRLRIASWLLYAVSGLALTAGLAYFASPTIMPYHEQFLGKTHHQLEAATAALLLAMMQGGGALFCALGLGLAVIAAGPFRKGDRWAWWAVCVMGVTALLPLLIITLRIGSYAPWWGPAGAILLTTTALWLSRGA